MEYKFIGIGMIWLGVGLTGLSKNGDAIGAAAFCAMLATLFTAMA